MRRDFLLSLAVEGSYRPIWSSAILDEVTYTERHKLIKRGVPEDEAEQRAANLVAQIRKAFFGVEVEGWELIAAVGLPDEKDEHVLAAALVGGAEAIVTHNHKDFPPHLVPVDVRVLHPTEFAFDMVAADLIAAAIAS